LVRHLVFADLHRFRLLEYLLWRRAAYAVYTQLESVIDQIEAVCQGEFRWADRTAEPEPVSGPQHQR